MSLVFNEAALNFLLESPEGPVGRDLERRAINVTRIVRERATFILEEMDPEAVQYAVVNDDQGLSAVIGVTSGGRSDRYAKYLAAKEQREANIFAPALQIGLHE